VDTSVPEQHEASIFRLDEMQPEQIGTSKYSMPPLQHNYQVLYKGWFFTLKIPIHHFSTSYPLSAGTE
jgi:hypothetical protein